MKIILILIVVVYITTWIIFFIKMHKVHKETLAILDNHILYFNKIAEKK